MTKKEELHGVLSPIDTLTEDNCTPEWEKLRKALKDDRVTNIAVTSSYGMGKTSFLESFFKKEYDGNYKERYKFISVPNFTSTNQQDAETKLEQNIINQLLFTVNSKKYSYSRIGRIKRYNPISKWLIFCAIWTVVICYLYLNSSFEKSKNLGVYAIGLVIIIVLSGLVYNFVVHSLSKITFGIKSKLGPVELSSSIETGKNEENLFIRYGDELIYYFQKSKVKFLILEDMDRFDNPEIFQNLRALNKVLNESLENNSLVGRMKSSWLGNWLLNILKKSKFNSRINQKNKIKFIYTLSDSIFDIANNEDTKPSELIDENLAAKQKSKFFDYIISIVPFNNLNVTKKLFEDELDKYSKNGLSKGSVDSNLIFGISSFITDEREIISIVSDMDTYIQKLQRKDQDSIDCNKLFAAMVYKNVYPIDFDNISKGKSNVDCILQNIDLLENMIEDANKDAIDLRNYYSERDLKHILRMYFDNKELSKYPDLSSNLRDALKFVNSTDILKFLLINGYIDLDLYEYISPTQFGDLTLNEIKFIRNVLVRNLEYPEFLTNNPKKLISMLSKINADYKYVFSSSIFLYELEINEKEKVRLMLSGAKNRRAYSFIFKVIKVANKKISINESIILGQWLTENWSDCFNITDKKKEDIKNIGNYAEVMATYVYSYLIGVSKSEGDALIRQIVDDKQKEKYLKLINRRPDSPEKKEIVARIKNTKPLPF